MTRPSGIAAAILLVPLATWAQAYDPEALRFDPHYPFQAELTSGMAFSSVFAGAGSTGTVGFARASFAGPVAELRQGTGLLEVDTSGRATVGGALRWCRSESPPWQSFIDAGAAADVWPRLAVGPLMRVGVTWRPTGTWGVGAQAGGAFLLGNIRIQADAGVTASLRW